MKVRCRNNFGLTKLEVGKIYEGELKFNEWLGEDRWYIKGLEGLYFEEQVFEIVKDDSMRKTFREVIADIKEGEVWESHCKKIIGFKDGDFEIRNNDGHKFGNAVSIRSANKYRLKRKEYSFEEVFKAYEEGKEIESRYSKYKYKKINGVDLYSKFENVLCDADSFGINEIRDKWYINN